MVERERKKQYKMYNNIVNTKLNFTIAFYNSNKMCYFIVNLFAFGLLNYLSKKFYIL